MFLFSLFLFLLWSTVVHISVNPYQTLFYRLVILKDNSWTYLTTMCYCNIACMLYFLLLQCNLSECSLKLVAPTWLNHICDLRSFRSLPCDPPSHFERTCELYKCSKLYYSNVLFAQKILGVSSKVAL